MMVKMRLRAMGLSQKEVSKELGMSQQTFARKLENKSEFKMSEIATLSKILDVPMTSALFFREMVTDSN